MTLSSINYQVIAKRLTMDRLKSYLSETSGDLESALLLYDWNIRASAAIHEDISRFEVLFRNAVADTLVKHGANRGWNGAWYRQAHLFHGEKHKRTSEAIGHARNRVAGRNRPEVYGKVIAELNFGFWRYLCHRRYLTSLWVPAIATAFPHHPAVGDAHRIRKGVEARMEKLHYTRNRIAHHEPIHRRNLGLEHNYLLEIVGWMCTESQKWVRDNSRTPSILRA